jgi:predicted MFS family arabinose efflux permease
MNLRTDTLRRDFRSTRDTVTHPHRPSGKSARAHGWGFWIAAAAFLLNMAFSAVPTPLYSLYAQRDGFSTVTITLIYAVYALGVIGSLFLGGHVSDMVGRKAVFVPALLINVASAGIFLLAPSLGGLIVARIISGVSIGLTTATATAYLAELHLGARSGKPGSRAQIVATAANLGGIGFGPLVAGWLAQYAPHPLQLPYIVVGGALAVLAVLVALSPETPLVEVPRPRYRPQRMAVPRAARSTFFAATLVALSTFAIFGVFTSLVPSFLAEAMGEPSKAIAGTIVFAAFAAGALAQILFSRWQSSAMLVRSIPILVVGLAVFIAGVFLASAVVFLVGGIVTGAGAGLAFRAAMVIAAGTASAESRAEVLAGFFVGGYIGLSVPVIGLGLASLQWPVRYVMLVFVALALAVIVGSVASIVRRSEGPLLQP